MIDRKTFLIGVLSLSAAILTAGHFQLTPTARATESVQVDDYQLATGLTRRGEDGLYILDKRRNLIALFSWDPSKRAIVPRDVRSVDDLLAGR